MARGEWFNTLIVTECSSPVLTDQISYEASVAFMTGCNTFHSEFEQSEHRHAFLVAPRIPWPAFFSITLRDISGSKALPAAMGSILASLSTIITTDS